MESYAQIEFKYNLRHFEIDPKQIKDDENLHLYEYDTGYKISDFRRSASPSSRVTCVTLSHESIPCRFAQFQRYQDKYSLRLITL